MIEIHFDAERIDEALRRLHGSEHLLSQAVRRAVQVAAPGVRRAVRVHLEQEVTVGPRLVRRAVKAVRDYGNEARFRVFSKNLLLDDYKLTPRERTARRGVRSSRWPGFSYRLRKSGPVFNSLGTLGGGTGTGSHPFLADTGEALRGMYRRANGEIFLVYGPSVQYHACAPEVEEEAREVGMELFHEALDRAVSRLLKENL